MTISSEIRLLVRTRADHACEFCGVTETDSGGELTVDHFCPQSKGGDDEPDNLVYCCIRCNQYKQDYWPASDDAPRLWNPRLEAWSLHFLELADGTLYPLTATGKFTIQRIRSNRPPLVAYRLRKRKSIEALQLLERHQDLLVALEKMHKQMSVLMEEQTKLLQQQKALMSILLDERHQ